MMYIDPVNLLNQRCDFIARCSHKNKFGLVLKNNGIKINNYDLLNW